jgi:predicted signal transduction protein with EAL and GGDEF domain
MAAELGLLVVAEGMEDMASVRLVRDLGAYAGQGFALSSALPGEAMARVLAGPALDLDGDVVVDLGRAEEQLTVERAPGLS